MAPTPSAGPHFPLWSTQTPPDATSPDSPPPLSRFCRAHNLSSPGTRILRRAKCKKPTHGPSLRGRSLARWRSGVPGLMSAITGGKADSSVRPRPCVRPRCCFCEGGDGWFTMRPGETVTDEATSPGLIQSVPSGGHPDGLGCVRFRGYMRARQAARRSLPSFQERRQGEPPGRPRKIPSRRHRRAWSATGTAESCSSASPTATPRCCRRSSAPIPSGIGKATRP